MVIFFIFFFLFSVDTIHAVKNDDQKSEEKKGVKLGCCSKKTDKELQFLADFKAFLTCCNNFLIEVPCDNYNDLREYFYKQLLEEETKKLDNNKD